MCGEVDAPWPHIYDINMVRTKYPGVKKMRCRTGGRGLVAIIVSQDHDVTMRCSGVDRILCAANVVARIIKTRDAVLIHAIRVEYQRAIGITIF